MSNQNIEQSDIDELLYEIQQNEALSRILTALKDGEPVLYRGIRDDELNIDTLSIELRANSFSLLNPKPISLISNLLLLRDKLTRNRLEIFKTVFPSMRESISIKFKAKANRDDCMDETTLKTFFSEELGDWYSYKTLLTGGQCSYETFIHSYTKEFKQCLDFLSLNISLSLIPCTGVPLAYTVGSKGMYYHKPCTVTQILQGGKVVEICYDDDGTTRYISADDAQAFVVSSMVESDIYKLLLRDNDILSQMSQYISLVFSCCQGIMIRLEDVKPLDHINSIIGSSTDTKLYWWRIDAWSNWSNETKSTVGSLNEMKKYLNKQIDSLHDFNLVQQKMAEKGYTFRYPNYFEYLKQEQLTQPEQRKRFMYNILTENHREGHLCSTEVLCKYNPNDAYVIQTRHGLQKVLDSFYHESNKTQYLCMLSKFDNLATNFDLSLEDYIKSRRLSKRKLSTKRRLSNKDHNTNKQKLPKRKNIGGGGKFKKSYITRITNTKKLITYRKKICD